MTLLTNEQYQKLLENGKPENSDKNHPPVARLQILFSGCQWLLSELNPEHPNIAFGLCDLGMGFPEMGYVDLNEIEELAGNYGIVNFASFEGKYPLTVYWEAAHKNDEITHDDTQLKICYENYLKRNS